MQENDFEKSVQLKMQEFEIVPAAAVWDAVQARIATEKRKRRFLLLFFVVIVLMAGFVTVLLINNASTNKTGNGISKVNSAKNNAASKFQAGDVPSQTNTIQNKLKEIKEHEVNKSFSENKIPYTHASFPTSEPTTFNANNVLPQQKVYSPTAAQPNALLMTTSKPSPNLPLHKYYKSKETLLDDSLAWEAKKRWAFKDSSNDNPAVVSVAEKNNSGWSIGFNLDAGISNNVEGLNLFSAKSKNLLYYNALAQTSLATSGVGYAPALTFKHAASFGIGFLATTNLSGRVSLSVGVNYIYSSATSAVGSRVDSSFSAYDSVLQKTANIHTFYQPGLGTNVTNQYHLLQVPVHFNYRINKKAKPLLITAGLLPSFVIESNALYLNNQLQVYYPEKSQFNKFLLVGELGFLKAVTARKAELEMGPAIQYGFNSLTRWQVSKNQHLFFAGLKTKLIIR